MNRILLCIVLVSLFACKSEEDCINKTDGTSYAGPLRFVYIDSLEQNMLDPNTLSRIIVLNVKSKSGGWVNYKVGSTIGGNLETGYWHLDLTNRGQRPNCSDGIFECTLCVNEACELYITYSNIIDIDTINVLYEKITIYDENNCLKTYYSNPLIRYNGIEINEYETEFIGAAIIRK